ncbi:MAG: hypothetical protein J0H15_05180 [Xanthomonadales bacterium]|nr:hypothetical protein [Xanthomonadales bacterium]
MIGSFVFSVAIGAATVPAMAEVPVYDDALAGGFEDWSWGGGVDLANTTPVHAGSRSIRFTGNDWNALSIHAATTFPTAQTGLRFWIHGGGGGGQQLALVLEKDGAASSVVPLNPLGVAPSAGQWKEVKLGFASIAALAGFAEWNRFSVQSNVAGAQAPLYIDDLAITEAGGPDPIFASGFEGGGPPAPNGLTIERDVAIDGLAGDRFSWRDSAGQPRVAVLAHNDGGTGPGGTRGGELREFRYQAAGATRVVRAVSGATGGFGYVVSHPPDDATCLPGVTPGGAGSSLGHSFGGHFQRVFEGRHHAIFRFTQAYPRYCTVAGAAQQFDLPVTIDWVFASGRDHPLWSVTWDVAGSGATVDRLADDSRAPYGELRIDGAASDAARAQIAGVAWGDWYRFTTTSALVTFDSQWTWTQPNTIPFVKLWTQGVDATMGIVQSRPITRQDAGGYWGQDSWGKTSANGAACPPLRMPCDYNWPFQSINYELYGGPTQNARLAWGTNFGFLGQASYPVRGNSAYGGGALALPGNPTAPGWPKKSYSTWIVLGTHTGDPVGRQVADMEAIEAMTLTAAIGQIATSGRSGVGDATAMGYQPVGYDPVYGALTFVAAANRLDADIALAPGAVLRQPLLIVRGWSAGLPATVKLGGAMLVRDVDYFPSVRADSSELWITLDRSLAGVANRIEVAP